MSQVNWSTLWFSGLFQVIDLKLYIIVLLGLWLSGCGFHLRGAGPIAHANLYLETVQAIQGFGSDFDDALHLAGGKAVSTASEASGVVHVYQLLSQKRSLTLGRFGRTNEFDLIYRLVFDVRSPKGEVLSPRQEIELHRDYYNDQSLPIAQQEEEGLIRTEMRKEIAQALVRRATYAISTASQPKS